MTTDLDELDALRAAATPWHEESLFRMLDSIPALRGADAAFIVAACNAIGPLIERVREAEAEIEARKVMAERHVALDEDANAIFDRRYERVRLRAEAAEARVKEMSEALRMEAQVAADAECDRDNAEARLATLEAGIRALADRWGKSHSHETVTRFTASKAVLDLLTKGGE